MGPVSSKWKWKCENKCEKQCVISGRKDRRGWNVCTLWFSRERPLLCCWLPMSPVGWWRVYTLKPDNGVSGEAWLPPMKIRLGRPSWKGRREYLPQAVNCYGRGGVPACLPSTYKQSMPMNKNIMVTSVAGRKRTCLCGLDLNWLSPGVSENLSSLPCSISLLFNEASYEDESLEEGRRKMVASASIDHASVSPEEEKLNFLLS